MLNIIFNFAILHRIRGAQGNLFDKIPSRIIVLIGIFLTALSYSDYKISSVITVGYFFYILFGWGSYFIHPDDFKLQPFIVSRQREISWIDWLISKLPPYMLLQNFFGMVLRGFFTAPLFTALYFLGFHEALLAAFSFPFFMAFSYLIPPYISFITRWNFDYTSYCEGLTGASFGYIIWSILNG